MAHPPLSCLAGQKKIDNTNSSMEPEQAACVFVSRALPASYPYGVPCPASALYSGFSIAGSVLPWKHAVSWRGGTISWALKTWKRNQSEGISTSIPTVALTRNAQSVLGGLAALVTVRS